MYRRAHLPGPDAPLLRAGLHKPVGGDLLVGEGDEGADDVLFMLGDFLHVVLEVFGVGDHDRAVEVILRLAGLLVLIEDAGVEDGLDPLVDEPLDVPVGELGGVALGLGGDGLHAALVEFAARKRGQHHPKAQFLEEGGPEGIVFVLIQYPRNADHAAGGVFKRRIVEHALLLEGHHVRRAVPVGVAAEAAFTAVAGDMPSPAGEFVDREQAVVLTAAAARRGCGIGEGDDLLETEHRGLLPVPAVPCDQRRAESAHDARNVGAGGLHTRDLLKGAQDSLVVKGAALDHDMAAEFFGIGELDDLVQGVFDDRVGKARGDVRHRRAFLLGLLDVGVHEHRAPRPEVHRVRRVQGLPGKGLGRVAEGTGKVFDEGAAAGGAGLIQEHRIHGAVSELDALHVLPADIQYAVNLRVEESRRRAVGDGLHFALIQGKGGFEQALAVAGRAGAHDPRAFGHDLTQTLDGGNRGFDGVSLVGGVEGEEKLPLSADEGKLRRGGARVDAEEAVAPVGFEIGLFHNGPAMALTEGAVVVLAFKQRRQALELEGHGHPGVELSDQPIHVHGLRAARLEGCTPGSKEMGVVGIDDVLIAQAQRADKGFFELRQKMQRPAQKGHTAPDRLSAGKT